MEDLEKERGAVMEEYRGNRNANGRMQDAHWILMMEGSKVVLQPCSNSCTAHLTSLLLLQIVLYSIHGAV